jgi:hypothetical protein
MLKLSLPVRLASPIIVRLPPALNFGATTLISQLECSGFMANLPISKLNNFAAIVSGARDPYSWIFPGDAMLIISQRRDRCGTGRTQIERSSYRWVALQVMSVHPRPQIFGQLLEGAIDAVEVGESEAIRHSVVFRE